MFPTTSIRAQVFAGPKNPGFCRGFHQVGVIIDVTIRAFVPYFTGRGKCASTALSRIAQERLCRAVASWCQRFRRLTMACHRTALLGLTVGLIWGLSHSAAGDAATLSRHVPAIQERIGKEVDSLAGLYKQLHAQPALAFVEL